MRNFCNMKCPKCGGTESLVLDSRLRRNDTVRWRRKSCADCGAEWSSVEVPMESNTVRIVVLCNDCQIQGACMVENMLRKAGTKVPFCSAGKRKEEA